jgi:uncharacterized protein (TIGR03437 family)
MIRLVIAFLCAAAACMLIAGALTSAQAPASSTPDPFVTQVSSSAVNSFAGDISANGRFVVVESNGDISTEKTATRNNQDGNREIFLYDYAQRRIFQLTDTRSVLNPPGSPSPTPSPSPSPSPSVSPSPTASPTPTPIPLSNIAIEISNNRPMISLEPALVSGQRTYTIVFSSNAPVTPASFDGTNPGGTIATDMNQEIWTYQFTVADTLDLTSGADVGPIDLTTGTFKRITDTPASIAPIAGSATNDPQVADDNRDASISDDGKIIAFSSNRNLVPAVGNLDAGAIPNPEIFLYSSVSSSFTQVTNTKSTSLTSPIFNDNPCLSSDGSVLAFVSNADLTANNADGNAEIYLANVGGGAVSNLRQVTKTKDALDSNGHVIGTATFFSFGRRLSRDGRFIALESLAADPGANAAPTTFSVAFIYDVSAGTFAQLGPRPTATPGDIFHFPTFTDYDSSLSPKSVVFTSALNFKADGTLVDDTDTAGLNTLPTGQTVRPPQLFLAPLPVTSTGPFTRITNIQTFGGLRGLLSNTRTRLAFSFIGELGGGNADGSTEVFYQLLPTDTTESTGSISLFTGASLVPVASPTASPVPSPTGSPFIAPGLAAGELAVAQFSLSPAPLPASVTSTSASESLRSPALPIELRGTSISINGAACGIYAVTATSISFVVPNGLVPPTGTASYPVVINSNGAVIRGQLVIVAAQPDIFTDSNGPGGRAVVCNITNPITPGCLIEPFNVTSDDGTGTQVPTVLELHLTGVGGTAASSITVTIGTTVIVPTNVIALDQPGFQVIDFTLPATVNTGDLPIVVAVGTATSRPADSAPHVTINP